MPPPATRQGVRGPLRFGKLLHVEKPAPQADDKHSSTPAEEPAPIYTVQLEGRTERFQRDAAPGSGIQDCRQVLLLRFGLHDLRTHKLTDFYEERWRVRHSIERNGDLYPTHGLGPVAQWLDVNRGNRFDYLVSMATPGRGLSLWAAEHLGADSPAARQAYRLGDVVTTMIRTTAGQTILVVHDTNSPRPYSRNILLQGTRGIVRKYPDERIHVEGRSPAHRWEELEAYRGEFEHPLWRTLEERARGAGHGGMDFIEDLRLVQCLRAGRPLDMDVYDGAAWSAISELSERSIRQRSRSVDVPDFTRGAWKTRPPLHIPGA